MEIERLHGLAREKKRSLVRKGREKASSGGEVLKRMDMFVKTWRTS